MGKLGSLFSSFFWHSGEKALELSVRLYQLPSLREAALLPWTRLPPLENRVVLDVIRRESPLGDAYLEVL